MSDKFATALDENDGENLDDFIEDQPWHTPDDPLAYDFAADEGRDRRRLPKAPKVPERRSLESFDRERVICVHELARAMEEFATKEPVQLYGGSIEFEEAAAAVLELAGVSPKCDLKGR